jgi:hypothetical protein
MNQDFENFMKNDWGKKNDANEKWYYEQAKNPNSFVSKSDFYLKIFLCGFVVTLIFKAFTVFAPKPPP